LLHGLNASKSVIGDHLYVTEVLHDGHEVELLIFGLGSFRKVLDSSRDVLNKIADVVNLIGGVLEEVLGVFLNPLLDGAVESVDQRLGANLQPGDIVDELLTVNLVLDGV